MNLDDRSRVSLINPYRSPRHDEPPTEVAFNPHESTTRAECLRRGWLFRRLRLMGRIATTLEWDASGPIETIRVGGQVVSSVCPFWYATRFDFLLPIPGHGVSGCVEVRLTRVLPIALRSFRLLLEGREVYREGH